MQARGDWTDLGGTSDLDSRLAAKGSSKACSMLCLDKHQVAPRIAQIRCRRHLEARRAVPQRIIPTTFRNLRCHYPTVSE